MDREPDQKNILDSDTNGRLTHSFLSFSPFDGYGQSEPSMPKPLRGGCIQGYAFLSTIPARAHSHGFHQLGASSIASTGHYPIFPANSTIYFPDGRMDAPNFQTSLDVTLRQRVAFPSTQATFLIPPVMRPIIFFSNLRNTEISCQHHQPTTPIRQNLQAYCEWAATQKRWFVWISYHQDFSSAPLVTLLNRSLNGARQVPSRPSTAQADS